MRPFHVVVIKVVIDVLLHFIGRFVERRSALDSKVLVQEGSVEAFDEAVASGAV